MRVYDQLAQRFASGTPVISDHFRLRNTDTVTVRQDLTCYLLRHRERNGFTCYGLMTFSDHHKNTECIPSWYRPEMDDNDNYLTQDIKELEETVWNNPTDTHACNVLADAIEEATSYSPWDRV